LGGIEPNDQQLQQLNDIELSFFMGIKEKKQINDEERNQKNDSSRIKTKRVEEKQKMIFKKAFKHIETSFYTQNKKKVTKRIPKKEKNHMQFYEHYFGMIARKKGINISNFLHPQKHILTKVQKSKGQIVPGLRSFNQT